MKSTMRALAVAVLLYVAHAQRYTFSPPDPEHDYSAVYEDGKGGFVLQPLDKEEALRRVNGELVEFLDQEVAIGMWSDDVLTTGWSLLQIHTNAAYPNKKQMSAAGYYEGTVSQRRMYQQFKNTITVPKEGTPLFQFFQDNHNWVGNQVEKNPEDPFWHQVGLLEYQIQGIAMGYHDAAPANETLSAFDVRMLSLDGDMETLAGVVKGEVQDLSKEEGHCSALVKVLKDGSDIFFAHDTWTSFNSMLRVYKLYDFALSETETGQGQYHGVKAQKVAFSSYPGSIYSGDDFYTMSSGLATQETTNGCGNSTLYKYITPHTVLEYARNVVANRLAEGGKDWTEIFAKNNSGTYNNQWMILNYNEFTPGHPVKKDTLWILEQIPGYTESADVSNVLASQGYWPSFNIPYFKNIWDICGFPANAQKYGEWFTHDGSPRFKIFERDHHTVTDIKSMQHIMRYADYKVDPLSKCDCDPPYSSENTICTRGDLNPKNGTYPFSALGYRNHVGSDSKIMSRQRMPDLAASIISGPTYQDNPVFVWESSPMKGNSHMGHPPAFDFPFQTVDWKTHQLIPEGERVGAEFNW